MVSFSIPLGVRSCSDWSACGCGVACSSPWSGCSQPVCGEGTRGLLQEGLLGGRARRLGSVLLREGPRPLWLRVPVLDSAWFSTVGPQGSQKQGWNPTEVSGGLEETSRRVCLWGDWHVTSQQNLFCGWDSAGPGLRCGLSSAGRALAASGQAQAGPSPGAASALSGRSSGSGQGPQLGEAHRVVKGDPGPVLTGRWCWRGTRCGPGFPLPHRCAGRSGLAALVSAGSVPPSA